MIVRNKIAIVVFLIGILTGAGCTLETETPETVIPPAGTDLVLTEFYSIPPDRYYSYSWIEMYNPTNHDISFLSRRSLGGDTLELSILSVSLVLELRIFEGVGEQIIAIDTAAASLTPLGVVSSVPGAIFGLPVAFPSDSAIPKGKFLVITNNENRFYSHFRLGPFDPTLIELGAIGHFDTTRMVAGPARWYPMPSGEVRMQRGVYILKDTLLDFPAPGIRFYRLISSTEELIDEIRYGNYVPNPDPNPGNQPLGMIPENWSVARYAGYYKTGNTRDAFYLSDSPIPGWYSQRRK